MILPFPAGSATDGASRFIAAELQKNLGQPVIVENQPGADGIIAAQNAKRAAPDGYTLFVSTNSAHGANPAIYTKLPYDPEKDFEPVAGLIRIPQLMVVRKDFPAGRRRGLRQGRQGTRAAKELTFGSGNTSSRVAAELLKVVGEDPDDRHSLQGHAASAAGSGRRPDRRVLRRSLRGHGLDQRRPAQGARADRHGTPALLPKVPTMAEAGYKDVQDRELRRRVRAGEDRSGDRRSAQQGDQQGPRDAAGEGLHPRRWARPRS